MTALARQLLDLLWRVVLAQDLSCLFVRCQLGRRSFVIFLKEAEEVFRSQLVVLRIYQVGQPGRGGLGDPGVLLSTLLRLVEGPVC